MDENRGTPDGEKYKTYLKWRAIEGWCFAKNCAFMTSSIMLFFGLVLLFAMKDVEFQGWRLDCVRAMGLVGALYIVANALVGYDVFRFERKMQRRRAENSVRRKSLHGVNDNPDIEGKPANVARLCKHCDPASTDSPELLVLTTGDGSKRFQVMCPKCWRHTAWFDTPAEAEEAWNLRRVWVRTCDGDDGLP